jgi:hypothetical protein
MPARRSVSLSRLDQAFRQYTSTGPIVGDHDLFNGSYDRRRLLANG